MEVRDPTDSRRRVSLATFEILHVSCFLQKVSGVLQLFKAFFQASAEELCCQEALSSWFCVFLRNKRLE